MIAVHSVLVTCQTGHIPQSMQSSLRGDLMESYIKCQGNNNLICQIPPPTYIKYKLYIWNE